MRKIPLLLLFLLTACSTPDPKLTGGARVMKPGELIALAKGEEDYLLLDVRTPAEFSTGHIPSANNLPHAQIVPEVPRLREWIDGKVIVYDETGKRSAMVARVLLNAGHRQVFVLDGHMEKWRQKKRPMQ